MGCRRTEEREGTDAACRECRELREGRDGGQGRGQKREVYGTNAMLSKGEGGQNTH